MKSFALLLILPSVVYGSLIFGGADTAKRCRDALAKGTVRDNVPDPDNCSQYYVCSRWFQSKMRCMPGMHFSATEKRCLEPCAAACDTSLICTTTAEPEISTEATSPGLSSVAGSVSAKSSDADTSSTAASSLVTSESSDNASEATGSAVTDETSQSAATDASSAVTNDSSTAADASTTDASDASTGATDAEGRSSEEELTTGTPADVAETSTAFWQAIAKHFQQPPTAIPGFTGSIPV